MSRSDTYDVIIAGAGPSGTSAAIYLALNNLKVLLLEQKAFPRPKLCGEFISPECRAHFDRLGVDSFMIESGAVEVAETVFYSLYGNRIVVPSSWFGSGAAMGLSRAEMDNNLLRRAKQVGVDVIENAVVSNLIKIDEVVKGVELSSANNHRRFYGHITIDATGRASVLTRRLKDPGQRTTKPRLVAFKAHFENTLGDKNVCEIYSYRGGYGGLSTIESRLSNLCFIVEAKSVRAVHSDPDLVMRNTVLLNPRASQTLKSARIVGPWLSVALEGFGRKKLNRKKGLLTIGDSAAFIDPFTGSGMLMALESGELAASAIVRSRSEIATSSGLKILSNYYSEEYAKRFNSRLRFSGMLRRVAFQPRVAQITIGVCGLSDSLRNWVAKSTRAKDSDRRNSPIFGG